jgi:5'-phosphate synthase pdxT subunit
VRIGVLALQGSFAEHMESLRAAGAEPVPVRLPQQMEGLQGMIVPGGESTTIGKLMVRFGLLEPLRRMAREGAPVWGTCAGMILLAGDIGGLDQPLIGSMHIRVKRNAFGRQVDSFTEDISIPALGGEPFKGIFIRAPLIEEVGPEARVFASLADGRIVAAEEGNLLASAFHPELTGDSRMHRYFVSRVESARG